MAEFRASERCACELMEIPRMSHRYQSQRDDRGLRERLLELAREKPRYGYRRLHVLLSGERCDLRAAIFSNFRWLRISLMRFSSKPSSR